MEGRDGRAVRIKVLGAELETTVSQETANKIAVGIAGAVTGAVVVVAGAAFRSPALLSAGGRMIAGSMAGAGVAIGAQELIGQLQPHSGAESAEPGAAADSRGTTGFS